jgi:hypothetical protein
MVYALMDKGYGPANYIKGLCIRGLLGNLLIALGGKSPLPVLEQTLIFLLVRLFYEEARNDRKI